MKMEMEIRFCKNVEFLNQSECCIFDDPCLSSLSLTDCVRKPADNFRDFCVSLAAPDNRWHKCHLLSNKT